MAEKVRRKQWRDEDMRAAIVAVTDDKIGVSTAATKYGVPRKTLDDRVKGRVRHGVNPGAKAVLTSEEESSLVSYLVYMSERGFPLTRTMVKAFAWSIAMARVIILTKMRIQMSTGGQILKIGIQS